MRDDLIEQGSGETLVAIDAADFFALAVGLSYLFGAFVPVWAYIFFEPTEGVIVSAISTVVVLFAVGALKTIITSRSWWRSGLESMLTGIAAAGVTYAAGRLFAAR